MVSQCETVSSGKKSRIGRFCRLDFWLGGWEFAGNDGVREASGLVRAVAERLVGRMAAAAKADSRPPSQPKGAPLRIDNLEVPLHANRSVTVYSDLGSSHSGLRKS